jgi:hypothetical protein
VLDRLQSLFNPYFFKLTVIKLTKMRTVTILGLMAIADAIRENWLHPQNVNFLCVIIVFAIAMDLCEFMRKMLK